MFEFTNRGRKALTSARDFARESEHSLTGSEHILYGVAETEGIAKDFLKKYDVDRFKVKQILNRLSSQHEGSMREGEDEFSLSPRSRAILESAQKMGKRLGVGAISPELILISLIEEGQGLAYVILKSCSVDTEKLREELLEAIRSLGENSKEKEKIKEEKAIETYSRDLTKDASLGKADAVIGRVNEIERILEILSRRTKNNIILTGEPGVGKTAVVEGLALKIIKGEVPEILKNKRILMIDLPSLLAGTRYRGEFEERLKKLVDEVRAEGNIILFIDEIHNLIGTGGGDGAMDAANILKPALARGEIQCIGATTIEEYRKYFEKDSALDRRFQRVLISEPTVTNAIKILEGVREKYEKHHHVKITDDALKAAAYLSDRYIAGRFLPDKAIDLIDEASARVRINGHSASLDLSELEMKLKKLAEEKEDAINIKALERAVEIGDEERETAEKIRKIKKDSEMKSEEILEVTENDIADVLSRWTDIPVSKLTEEDKDKLLNLEAELHKRVVGQDEAIKAVSDSVRRSRVGLKDPQRPTGSFIFLGSSGVGKTEVSKALAEILFGSEKNLIRIDMSEYMEKHSVSRLIGSPPGYVGHDEGGQLTEAVRRKPYSVILLDEIEKAHKDIFNLLLQVLEDGRLTDGLGKTVDFRNTVIILTSNVGIEEIRKRRSSGAISFEDMRNTVIEELKEVFKPELINRLDEIIVFHDLTDEEMRKIVEIMINELKIRAERAGIRIRFSKELIDFLSENSFDPLYGARPLRRKITHLIENPLSEKILRKEIDGKSEVLATAENGTVKFIKE